ncbi:MAG TPA: PEP/pyruvate-binding domain-containing protein [Anaerolineae bacterium]|nr:PEP/pyruvate-binding domain-containing protein [Anaerolineae bacterium]
MRSNECLESALVGSKATNLAKMALQGFPVPEGYVLTVKAFRDFCKHNRIVTTGDVDAEEVSKAICEGEFPPKLMQSIDWGLDKYPIESFAVRSSAVGEDGIHDSMAGQLQTFLNIPRELVYKSIKECWAAIFNDRVTAYREKRRLTSARVMGVIVQKQIQPLYAGVLFSLDPYLKTADHLVIEWVWGIGEQLVSGNVTPERLYVHRKSPVISDGVSESLGKSLEQIVSLSLEIERLFEHPVDIEWCVDATCVYILQARPITALARDRAVIFSNVNIGENYPQPLSPFTWSIVESFRSAYFRALFRRFGLPDSVIDDASPVIDNLVGVQSGVVYYNLSNWYEMVALFPMGRWLRKFLDNYIGQHVPFRYMQRHDTLRIFREWRYFYWGTWFWLRLLITYLTLERQVKAFERDFYYRRKQWRNRPLDELTLEELEDELLDIKGFLDKNWGGAALADFSAMVFPGILEAVSSRWLDISSEMTIARLLQGLTLKSTESLKLLWRIARGIGELTQLKNLLLDGDYETLNRSLSVELRDLVDDFMEQFGGRCYHELMITSPTFEERTDLFWDLVKSYLLSPDKDPFMQEQTERANREAFTEECLRHIRGIYHPVFRKVLHDAQSAIGFRERVRLCQSLIYGELRRTVLELGKRLTARNHLLEPEDVFYLEFEELLQLIEGKFLYPETIPSIVSIRKEAHLACGMVGPPEFLVVDKGDYLKISHAETPPNMSEGIFKGLGVSGGSVTGRTRVILDPVEQNQLCPGEILVTRVTDPGWTPLFLIAGGLILEKGGLLSHGAIVAREFGIPAIVGVRGATQLLNDGQLVCLNGDTGEIRLLAEGEEPC